MNATKLLLICIAMVIFIPPATGGVVWLAHYQTNFPVPASRHTRDFMAAIEKSEPSLFTASHTPIFTITDTDHVAPNWYIVSIRQTGKNDSVISKLIINDPYFSADYMNVVAGPETQFSSQELQNDQIPNSVIQDSNK